MYAAPCALAGPTVGATACSKTRNLELCEAATFLGGLFDRGQFNIVSAMLAQ